MGLGLLGARRLMDEFHIASGPGKGTAVRLKKRRPHALPPTPAALARLLDSLTQADQDPFIEIQKQNQELLSTMAELGQRQDELAQLNRELEDTNRGVVALYAELDEKADYLRRASEIKSRFLSNMTHEFRTPLNSILSLSRMLLDRTDGELTTEQEKQVFFIRRSATDLSELVNDLLDLSKVEAGKVVIRPSEFQVADLFGALRGMLRPLLAHNSSINLIFEEPTGLPPAYTDESKLSQILRNFIANALKFTENGEVRVSARVEPGRILVISVADTGIGIAEEDQARIFEEFTQVEGPHQKKMKGTGLGLPLSRKLAELLGGSVTLESTIGQGSVFSVALPLVFRGATELAYMPELTTTMDPARLPVLVIDDNTETLFIYENYLKGTPFQVVPVRSLKEAREVLTRIRPVAVILDILLENESSWGFIEELKRSDEFNTLPLFIVTMVENEGKARALGADEFHLKPVEREWLLQKLRDTVSRESTRQALIIDDDEVARYLVRGFLAELGLPSIEAAGGHEGLRLAREILPSLIVLDISMPDMNGIEVLDRLRRDPLLADIPVIVHTSRELTPAERSRIEAGRAAVLPKSEVSQKAFSTLLEAIHVPARDRSPAA
jgi:signal transduction histidine kinase/CheY-like chemotaxis protein